MQQHPRLTRAHFENALTPECLRVTRLIQLALMMGPFFMALTVFLIFTQGQNRLPSQDEIDMVNGLTVVHLAATVAALFLGFFMAIRIASPDRLPEMDGADADGLAVQCSLLQRSAIIIRLAIMEGAAFFGLSVCIIAATNGVLASDANYWINMLSTVLIVLVGIATFPTKERLVSWFEKTFEAV